MDLQRACGAGTVVGFREDGTYDVQLDSSETVQNCDGPTMKEETTHFDAAAEDSGDEKMMMPFICPCRNNKKMMMPFICSCRNNK